MRVSEVFSMGGDYGHGCGHDHDYGYGYYGGYYPEYARASYLYQKGYGYGYGYSDSRVTTVVGS
jgi:hypothetical protein